MSDKEARRLLRLNKHRVLEEPAKETKEFDRLFDDDNNKQQMESNFATEEDPTQSLMVCDSDSSPGDANGIRTRDLITAGTATGSPGHGISS